MRKMRIRTEKRITQIQILFGITIFLIGLAINYRVQDNNLFSKNCMFFIILGNCLSCGGYGRLYRIKKLEKNPNKYKEVEIETSDERNQFIRLKSSSISGEITNWIIIIFSCILLILDAPYYIIFSLVFIYISKYIVQLVLFNRFNKLF